MADMWSRSGRGRFTIEVHRDNCMDECEAQFVNNVADQMLPIYMRTSPRVKRPVQWCTKFDIEEAWSAINPPYGVDHAWPAFKSATKIGLPQMLFIGSSHIHHLSELIREPVFHTKTKETVLHYMCDRFVLDAEFVGVGGLKWWTMDNELHGHFVSCKKYEKYGNQWLNFHNSGMIPDVATIVCGCNDVDDYLNYIMDTTYWSGSKAFQKYADESLTEWFDSLTPVIASALSSIQKLLPRTRLFYMPITPRKWWHVNARSLANRLDHFIAYKLCQEHIVDVKLLSNQSLFKKSNPNVLQNVIQDINPAFLERDNVHMNIWGYEAFIRDIAGPIMGYHRSKLN